MTIVIIIVCIYPTPSPLTGFNVSQFLNGVQSTEFRVSRLFLWIGCNTKAQERTQSVLLFIWSWRDEETDLYLTKKHGGVLVVYWWCPRGVMVKAMSCGIVVREFVLQSRYYVHFRANTLGKGMNLLILPPAMGK